MDQIVGLSHLGRAVFGRTVLGLAMIPPAAAWALHPTPFDRSAQTTRSSRPPVTKIVSCTLPALTAALARGGTIEFECSGTILIRKTLNISGHVKLIGGNNSVILAPYDNTITGRLLNIEKGAVYEQSNVTMQGAYLAPTYGPDAADGASGAAGQNGTGGGSGTAGKPGGPAANGVDVSDHGGAAIFVAGGATVTITGSVFNDDIVTGNVGGFGGWGGNGGRGGSGSTNTGTSENPNFGASGSDGAAGADGGSAGDGGTGGAAQGGAILNLGTLTLSFDIFENNSARGGAGGGGGNGGIASEGGDGGSGFQGRENDKGNYISAGGNGGDAGAAGQKGGLGGAGGVGGAGEGGAVFNEGTLTVDGGEFTTNTAVGGAAGWGGYGGGAFSGSNPGQPTESGGAGGAGNPPGKEGKGADGGSGNVGGGGAMGAMGLGGAIYNVGKLDVCSAQFQSNSATGGAGGGGGAGGPGANGGSGSQAGSGGSGADGGTGGLGGAASGGGMYSKTAVATHGATFSKNTVIGGAAGGGGPLGAGGQPGFGAGGSRGASGSAGVDGHKGSVSGVNGGGSVTIGTGAGASCPLVSSLSVHSAAVNSTGGLIIYGAGFTGATKIVWECLNGAGGMYISKKGQFKVLNAAGTAISVPVLPGPVDPLLAQDAAACGFSLDSRIFPFDVEVWVGAHHSPAVVGDRFDYLGPHVDSMSVVKASVGEAPRRLKIDGTNFDGVTKVLFACVGQTAHGFGYGPTGFTVNSSGTQIAMTTPATAWTYIATAMARCKEPLDQDAYNFHVILFVGQVHSHGGADSLFTYFGPKIDSMDLHHLKIGSTARMKIVGHDFQSASAVEWDCATGVNGFRAPVSAADVSSDGSTITMKTPTGVSRSIGAIAGACHFRSNQQSYTFDVRVEVGSLYSARDATSDGFRYSR